MLFFRNQSLTLEQQRDFALQFGEAQAHPIYSQGTSCPEVTVLEFGEDIDPNKEPTADIWHTDVTFLANPPTMGMLYAKIIPKEGGGDTLWANMVEIYKQELSDGMKQILSNLTAEHSCERPFKVITSNPAHKDQYMKAKEDHPPVNHPVICEHSHTKEKYLYVNISVTTKINELNKQESDLLLQYLFSLVNKRPEFTCRCFFFFFVSRRTQLELAFCDVAISRTTLQKTVVPTRDPSIATLVVPFFVRLFLRSSVHFWEAPKKTDMRYVSLQ